MKAYVTFSDTPRYWWTRFIKPGYHHCDLYLFDGIAWIGIEPRIGVTTIEAVYRQTEESFLAWLKTQGITEVVAAEIAPDPGRPAPFGFFTCVEMIKRIIGLHDRRVVTPWQLRKALDRHNSKMLRCPVII